MTAEGAIAALQRARLAGIEVAPQGDGIHIEATAEPLAGILEGLTRHKAAIVRILATERCEACHGAGTVAHPLLACFYAGHPLLLHGACVTAFLESDLAASPLFEPLP